MNPNNKILALDLAKGYAIFLVVWMHCIQYCAGITFNNPLFAFIYSFHMPLFLIISGYLYSNKLKKRTPFVNLTRRAKRLLVPNLLWGGLLCIIAGSFSTNGLLSSFWFLYTLFVVCVIYEIGYLLIHNVLALTATVSMLGLLLPGMEYVKFAIPFFGIGLSWANFKSTSINNKSVYVWGLSLISLLIYLFLWQGDEYIYITNCPGLHNHSIMSIRAYIVRILVGTALSFSVIAIVNKYDDLLNHTIIRRFSTSSLGIYVIHLFILKVLAEIFYPLHDILRGMPSPITDSIAFTISLALILIVNKSIECMQRSKYLPYLI